MSWRTKLTEIFPCRVPIVGAPMAGVSGGRLAAETTRAGALGFLAGGHLTSLESLEKEIKIFREALPEAPLCLGFIGHSTFCDLESWKRFQTVLEVHQPSVVQFFAPFCALHPESQRTNIAIAQEQNAKVLVQVCSVADAKVALEAGVDGIIAQGSEGGGHGFRRELGSGTLALAARVVSVVAENTTLAKTVPVLAAGGIVDGRGLAASLALGCDGIVLGTRLWASQEAMGEDSFKQMLSSPSSEPESVIRTSSVDQINNSYSSNPWPEPYDSVGMLRNETTDRWDGRNTELAGAMDGVAKSYKQAVGHSNPSIAAVYSGEGVGEIRSIDPAYDIVTKTSDDAISILRGMRAKFLSG